MVFLPNPTAFNAVFTVGIYFHYLCLCSRSTLPRLQSLFVGSMSDVGLNSILETDSNNIVVLGGVNYIAAGSQVNVLLNGGSPMIGIGEAVEDVPVRHL